MISTFLRFVSAKHHLPEKVMEDHNVNPRSSTITVFRRCRHRLDQTALFAQKGLAGC
jgi:hypothetical protein